jgi:hypothetical protein
LPNRPLHDRIPGDEIGSTADYLALYESTTAVHKTRP